ncbi:type IV secretion system protein [Allopusillimonas ginsengisoli]|uniref:type IV secretion system protein n=1 Tax=Allopusillimonas ginsengisoli TaxID=453575 RepID=UPI00101ED8B9|nr:type IV secretion system protein [Allopusillimonas ginsengisoli]TEA79225.1 type VI secretion protein [Allopusillimonas ginsengisoli]
MTRCKFLAAGIALSAAFLSPAHASGIPTVDAATIAQLQEQLLTARDQLKNLTEQLQTAKSQLAAFTQSSGYGNIASDLDIRNQLRAALPSSAQDLLDRSGSSGLNGDVSRITDDVMAPVDFSEDRQQLSKRALNIEATAKAMSERAYDSMTQRLANVDTLQSKINQTTNPKEIAELQARIQIEQANITAEQTRIELASQQLEAERNLLQARAERVYGGWFGNSSGSNSPTLPAE